MSPSERNVQVVVRSGGERPRHTGVAIRCRFGCPARYLVCLLLVISLLMGSLHAFGEELRPRRMLRLFLEIEDGDTVVYMGRHLRFLGVDTPEIRNPSLGFWKDQPYGREAKEFTRRQIEEARNLTYLSDGEDRYGRLLVHLFVDGYPLSVRIVESGLGYETVTTFGDNGFPEIAERILAAAQLHPDLPFEEPYLWRWKNRAR